MSVPYTREAIAHVRAASRSGVPAEIVQRHLGWDAARFAAICRRHQVELVGVPLASSPATPPPQRAADALGHILSKLTARQAHILGVLHVNSAGHWSDWISGIYIARVIGVKRVNNVTKGIGNLSSRLRRMGSPYQIESKLGRGGGYRLVIGKAVR